MMIIQLVRTLEAESTLDEGIFLLIVLNIPEVDFPGPQLVPFLTFLVGAGELSSARDDLLLSSPPHPKLVLFVPSDKTLRSVGSQSGKHTDY